MTDFSVVKVFLKLVADEIEASIRPELFYPLRDVLAQFSGLIAEIERREKEVALKPSE